MKYIRFKADDKICYGILKDDKIYELKGDFFENDGVSDKIYSLSDVKILCPVVPEKIVAVGLNYKDHIKELNHDIHKEPVIFLKPVTSLIGNGDKIVLPKMSEQVDYEGELALVIKKEAKNVDIKDALDYVLGYTCLNDVTARDLQSIDGQWTRAKGFDTFAPVGPYIDDSINPSDCDIKTLLNGEIKQHSNTNMFIYKIDYLISYISQIMTLKPGDIITTGTPSGIGKLTENDKIEIILNNEMCLTNYVEKR